MAKPKTGFIVVMVIFGFMFGTLFSIVWPLFTSRFMKPEWATDFDKYESSGDITFVLAGIKNAEKLGASYGICKGHYMYGGYAQYQDQYDAALENFQKCLQVATANSTDPDVSGYQGAALGSIAETEHNRFLESGGKPPAISNPLKDLQLLGSQKAESEFSAHNLEWTQRILADVYADNNDYEHAQEYFKKALTMAEAGKVGWQDGAKDLLGLARIKLQQGKVSEADQLFRQAVDKADTAFGGGNGTSEYLLRQYAKYLKRTGHIKESSKYSQLLDADGN